MKPGSISGVSLTPWSRGIIDLEENREITEPEVGTASTVMQVLQRTRARAVGRAGPPIAGTIQTEDAPPAVLFAG